MIHRRIALSAVIVPVVLCVAACGDDPADSAAQTSVEITVPSDQDPVLNPLIDAAVADLAQRLSIAPTDITVTSAKLVQWPDGSMGCPQPGQSYTQAVTDGAQIILTANGTPYDYHSGGSVQPFLCEQPAQAPPTTG